MFRDRNSQNYYSYKSMIEIYGLSPQVGVRWYEAIGAKDPSWSVAVDHWKPVAGSGLQRG